jgi:hypothetical protein
VGQLLQYYGQRDANGTLLTEQDPLQGVSYFDVRVEAQRDGLLNALDTPAEVILFDLPGGVMHELAKVLDGNERPRALLKEYQRAGYRVTIVAVMTPILASIRTVQEAVSVFGEDADYLAVKNLAFGDEQEFVLFDGWVDDNHTPRGGKSKTVLLEHGGRILTMPRLLGRTYALLDLYHLTFTQAIEDRRLQLADRSRVYQWRAAFDDAIDPAADWLGIAPPGHDGPPARAGAPAGPRTEGAHG